MALPVIDTKSQFAIFGLTAPLPYPVPDPLPAAVPSARKEQPLVELANKQFKMLGLSMGKAA